MLHKEIKQVFLSSNNDGTFNVIILFKNGKLKKTVKKFDKTQKVRKGKFNLITTGYYIELTCNHFSNYRNDFVELYETKTHYVFLVIGKNCDLDMCFTIKK